MKVGIYHMVLDPKRKSCITLELDILKNYARENHWEIYNTYLDMTNVESKKSELSKMIKDACNGCFDIVLMKNAYYISRHTPKYVEIRNKLHASNVKLITLCEGEC